MTTFSQLVTLRLDNNIISKIENIDHLVNLKWLDLSFNNITEISGLDKLINLTDLSLFHNQISTIGGFDHLLKLDILSLGKNNISDIREVIKLRKLPNLRCLCMIGNPVCKSETYEVDLLAILPRLTYVDYLLVTGSSKQVDQAMQSEILSSTLEQEGIHQREQEVQESCQKIVSEAREHFMAELEFLEDELCKEVPRCMLIMSGYEEKAKELLLAPLKDTIKRTKETILARSLIIKRRCNTFENAVEEAEFKCESETNSVLKMFKGKVKVLTADAKQLLHEHLVNVNSGNNNFDDDEEDELSAIRETIEEMADSCMKELKEIRDMLLGAAVDLHAAMRDLWENTLKSGLLDRDINLLKETITFFWQEAGAQCKVFTSGMLDIAAQECNTYAAIQGDTGNEEHDEEDAGEANSRNNTMMMALNSGAGESAETKIEEERKRLLSSFEDVQAAIAALVDYQSKVCQAGEDSQTLDVQKRLTGYYFQMGEDLDVRSRRRILEIKQASDEIAASILAVKAEALEDDDERNY